MKFELIDNVFIGDPIVSDEDGQVCVGYSPSDGWGFFHLDYAAEHVYGPLSLARLVQTIAKASDFDPRHLQSLKAGLVAASEGKK